ncbi:hypothetical protein [Ktedonospora formicarum]|uniref:asparagine synthase (glutamine-hydrolyzing) n=1 Tax=Ktedonospora formicarum TaxID=2778364 RepID=A0A8J3I184_9CHLR|nr:hypothetical protein [Ktedonospora formicarum]GHO43044.1 hypothetical protein KSX_12070 [Ktedonospora formicarum]
MAVLAGWITSEQVPLETIEQVLTSMGNALERAGGTPARSAQPGAGILSFSDTAYATRQNDDPPLLDWTPERRTLVYRRPVSGQHPLYYIEDWPAQGNLLFASEIKALLAVGIPRRLRPAGLAALLRYGFLPAPWTLFEDINIVPAGSHLRWQHTRLIISPPVAPSSEVTTPTRPDQIRDQLQEIVSGLIPPHPQPIVGYTGGDTDSTLALALAAYASENTSQQPLTLTSFDYKQSRDIKRRAYLRDLSQHWQSQLLEVGGVDQPEFWHATLYATETPCLDTRLLAWHQLLHTSALETGARVAFCGLGGSSHLETAAQPPMSDPLSAYAQTQQEALAYDLFSYFTSDLREAIHGTEPWELTTHARRLARLAEQLPHSEQRQTYLDRHLRLPDGLVAPITKLAQQEHIALHSPYLHPHLLSSLSPMPARDILAGVLPDGASPLLTNEQASLTLPCASLWQVEHSELLQSLLSVEALRATGLFDAQAVQQLLRQPPPPHISTSGRHPLVAIVTLQLWCQLYGVSWS